MPLKFGVPWTSGALLQSVAHDLRFSRPRRAPTRPTYDSRRVKYFANYPEELQERVRVSLDSGRLGEVLAQRYPGPHPHQSNAALYQYVQAIKRAKMASSPPLSKVRYCDKISTLNNALGTHTYATRIQGRKLKTKHELRVASVFKRAPIEFLDMIVVHELAHLREREHNKAFYRLCQHMLPDYHQLEFDMRLWLTWLELGPPARVADS